MEENALGLFIRAAREQKNLSLRAVEKQLGISNAYLSQIEGGKIKQPSPTILHKLSELYNISYSEVLKLAGYPIPDETEEVEGRLSELAARFGPITEEEEDALIEYLEFFRARKSRRE